MAPKRKDAQHQMFSGGIEANLNATVHTSSKPGDQRQDAKSVAQHDMGALSTKGNRHVMEAYDNAKESERLVLELANRTVEDSPATQFKATREEARQAAAKVALQNIQEAQPSIGKITKAKPRKQGPR